jgi:hypothetical protein
MRRRAVHQFRNEAPSTKRSAGSIGSAVKVAAMARAGPAADCESVMHSRFSMRQRTRKCDVLIARRKISLGHA